MRTFPLQVSYLKESDPQTAIILFGVLGILVAILIVLNISKNGIGSTGGRSGGGLKTRSHFSRWALKKTAAAYGLDSVQTSFLEHIFRKAQVNDPESTLMNPEILDRHFKKAFREIESSAETEAAAEEGKTTLFSIRTTVESAYGSSTRVISTRKLPDGMAAVLTGAKGETYPTRVLTAKGEKLLIEAPKNGVGTVIKFSRGTKFSLSFYTKSSQGYRFDTKAQGTEMTPKGPALELSHSDRVAPLPNRRHRRKEARISCYFSAVQILQRTQGRKIVKETIVDERRAMGTIVDISAGGCALKSAGAIRTGEYIKVEFDDSQGRPLAAFGRIVRTNKTGSVGGVMHIQFLKTTRKTLNAINATVYGYEQE
ncbi:MAG: flagellar brake protein [Treponemataceae bacterium]